MSTTRAFVGKRYYVLIVLICWGAAAGAQMQFVSQSRSVRAYNSEGGSDSGAAEDFGPFNDLAVVSWGNYTATGHQESTLSGDRIVVSSSATDTAPFYHYQNFIQGCSSDFQVQIEVNGPCQLALSGTLWAFGDYGGYSDGDYEARVTVSGDGGAVLYTAAMTGMQGFEGDDPVEIREQIALAPGRYTLRVFASAEGSYVNLGEEPGTGGSGWADCDVELTLLSRVLYVDNDAPGDPDPNNPLVSDPLEDGSAAHPFDSIQEAIDYAVEGDTIIAAEGIYFENLHISGKNIHLTGTDPEDWSVVENTVIDGRRLGSVVTFSGTEDSICRLSGLTLQNGRSAASDVKSGGGGICGGGTRAGVSRCIIRWNETHELETETYFGGGIYDVDGEIIACKVDENAAAAGGGLALCDGLIQFCQVRRNSAHSGMDGGGMSRCNGMIDHCEITDNTTEYAQSAGGGLVNCNGTISNCLIARNRTPLWGGGLLGCKARIINCRISDNISGGGGAGLYRCEADFIDCVISGNVNDGSLHEPGGGISSCRGRLIRCIIRDNRALNSGGVQKGSGGGVYNFSGEIIHCVVWNNYAGKEAGGLHSCSGPIRHSILWGNRDEMSNEQLADCGLPSYCCIENWRDAGFGNINLNPRFADPEGGDFHLKSQAGRWDPSAQTWVTDGATSPCIDAGDPSDPNWMGELWPHGRRVNLGVYGGTPQASLSLSDIGNRADLDNDGDVDTADLETFTAAWLRQEVQPAEDLNRNGQVNGEDFAVLSQHWLWEEPIVGFWQFDDAQGAIARDVSSGGHDGLLVNSPQWTAGRLGGGLRFDPNLTAVEIPTDGFRIDEGTISLWANAAAFYNTKHFLFGHVAADGGWSNRIQLFTNNTGELRLGFGDAAYLHTGIKTLQTWQWYHIVLTWDHSVYSVYVNGLLRATGSYSGFTALNSYADIGNNGKRDMRIESFDGIIDEVCVYNRALSGDEVYSLFGRDFAAVIQSVRAFAAGQAIDTAAVLTVGQYPRYTSSYAAWSTTSGWYWASGCFPGLLWLIYEAGGDTAFQTLAQSWTAGLESQAYTSALHDIGFIISNSYGSGYRITGNEEYRDVLLAAADRLSLLYNPLIGAVNLGWGDWQCPISIDTMMNIELLYMGAKYGGEAQWAQMASNHAYRTLTDLVREDGRTCQIADYDAVTGDLILLESLQGYSTESVWSRGQAFAVYGFTTAYRETGDPNFLAAAERTADYYIEYLPPDAIPYWDFEAPGIPLTERDTSAAAIAAAGLVELSTLTEDLTQGARYLSAARRTLESLCKSQSLGGYLGRDPEGHPLTPGLLMQGCQNHPDSVTHGTIADESLIWGDYYFLEALRRFEALP